MPEPNPERDVLLRELAPQVGDERVLRALAEVPRELFVAPELRDRAWENHALPIGRDQTISQPLVVAVMCALLHPTPDERVLDVGTGSGYHAAVLSRLAGHVYSIERLRPLAELARRNLAAAGIANVTVVIGDGGRGLGWAAPFDAINVAAATEPAAAAALAEQLAPGGRMVWPTQGEPQRLALVERGTDGALRRSDHGAVRFVPLVRDAPA